MIVKLLTEHHLKFLSFKGGCTDSFESTLVKMTHCWKSDATAHITLNRNKHFSLMTRQRIFQCGYEHKMCHSAWC